MAYCGKTGETISSRAKSGEITSYTVPLFSIADDIEGVMAALRG